MLGAIYIGLSGMDAYSKGLQVISNNIANLNTLGFKANSVTFSDLYSSSNGQGGLTYMASDTKASGAGVVASGSNVDFTQGTLQQSSGSLDLGIQGSGFLVLKDANNGTFYGRTGQFSVDDKGYISSDSGKYRLTTLDAANQATPVNITTDETNPPAATTAVSFSQNLSSTATTADVPSITVYDSTGASHIWDVSLAPVSGSAGHWTVTVKDETGATIGTSTLTFNGNVVDPTTSKFSVSTTPTGAAALSVDLDFSNVTSFSSGATSTLATSAIDGHAVGQLSTVTVDSTGHILVTYSNNQTMTLGAVALADFRDPETLDRASGGLFTSKGITKTELVASGSPGIGTIVSKQVESSNVDLTQEFGDLILIQRGFQASSQVVSVSNDMIQQLFGIRGQ